MRNWKMPKLNLKGSEKQIRWATEIVADVYATVNSNIKLAHDNQWPHPEKWETAFDGIISQLEGFLSKNEKAAVIISCRERFSSDRILYLANKYVNREALK